MPEILERHDALRVAVAKDGVFLRRSIGVSTVVVEEADPEMFFILGILRGVTPVSVLLREELEDHGCAWVGDVVAEDLAGWAVH